MGGVELDGVEAGLLHPPGGLAEQVDELEDLGDRRLADLLALLLGVLVHDLVARRPRQLEDPVRGAQRVVARDRALAPRVLELDGALRAVAVHRLGEAGEARARSCRRRRRGRSPSGRPVDASGVVAPTITNPVPPLAMFPWWWMSRSLTSPSACEELMSVGTWTIRLGSSSVPIWSGLNRCGKAMTRILLRVTGRISMRTRCSAPTRAGGNARAGRRSGRSGRGDPEDRRETLHMALSDAAVALARCAHGRLRLAAGHGARVPARGARVHRARRRGPDALARPLRDRAGGGGPRRVHVRPARAARRSPATSSSSTTPAARRARGPGLVAAPAAGPVPAGAHRRAGLPGAGPRATWRRSAWTSAPASPRVRGDDPARRRDRAASSTGCATST